MCNGRNIGVRMLYNEFIHGKMPYHFQHISCHNIYTHINRRRFLRTEISWWNFGNFQLQKLCRNACLFLVDKEKKTHTHFLKPDCLSGVTERHIKCASNSCEMFRFPSKTCDTRLWCCCALFALSLIKYPYIYFEPYLSQLRRLRCAPSFYHGIFFALAFFLMFVYRCCYSFFSAFRSLPPKIVDGIFIHRYCSFLFVLDK